MARKRSQPEPDRVEEQAPEVVEPRVDRRGKPVQDKRERFRERS